MHLAVAGMHAPPQVFGDEDDELVAAVLRERGHVVDLVGWDDPSVDWSRPDGVLVRSTWNYTDDVDGFLAWAHGVESVGTLLWNPAEVLTWNVHKGYLAQLEERGAPIVPTAWLGRGDRVDVALLAAERGWDGIVAKPAIGAGADGIVVVAPGGDAGRAQPAVDDLLATGDALVQPYVPSVAEGEVSVVVVDGEVSHAVRKVPTAGEVRTQVEFGARYQEEELDRDTARLAAWVVEATGLDLLYARVDLLRDVDGQWLLSELEVVEPALLFAWAPGSAARFADALLARAAPGDA